MKRILNVLISLISITSSLAQTTQKGIVQEYNEKAKKTPLAGVELNVRSANSTVSDKTGQFSLQFLTLKPGDFVTVRRIEKLGYEIFNKEAIEQWNLNPDRPFVIVMCKSDIFKQLRDNYEKVASASYARQLKKDQDALEKLKAFGIEHPDVATSYNNIGTVYFTIKQYTTSLNFYQKALEIYEKVYEPTHTNTILTKQIIEQIQHKLVNQHQ